MPNKRSVSGKRRRSNNRNRRNSNNFKINPKYLFIFCILVLIVIVVIVFQNLNNPANQINNEIRSETQVNGDLIINHPENFDDVLDRFGLNPELAFWNPVNELDNWLDLSSQTVYIDLEYNCEIEDGEFSFGRYSLRDDRVTLNLCRPSGDYRNVPPLSNPTFAETATQEVIHATGIVRNTGFTPWSINVDQTATLTYTKGAVLVFEAEGSDFIYQAAGIEEIIVNSCDDVILRIVFPEHSFSEATPLYKEMFRATIGEPNDINCERAFELRGSVEGIGRYCSAVLMVASNNQMQTCTNTFLTTLATSGTNPMWMGLDLPDAIGSIVASNAVYENQGVYDSRFNINHMLERIP